MKTLSSYDVKAKSDGIKNPEHPANTVIFKDGMLTVRYDKSRESLYLGTKRIELPDNLELTATQDSRDTELMNIDLFGEIQFSQDQVRIIFARLNFLLDRDFPA